MQLNYQSTKNKHKSTCACARVCQCVSIWGVLWLCLWGV